jgi:prepilin-type N-terminal cleavage/methylation domain-containing protein
MNQRNLKQSTVVGARGALRGGRTMAFPARRTQSRARRAARGGFTLVELLAVITIIGIILAFVMVAGMDAVRRAEERATQSLITKLEEGLNDRLEALLQTRPDYATAHLNMAPIYASNGTLAGVQRAQIIAWYDYIKSEIPDVFFPGTDGNYPLNFAGNAYPTQTTKPASAPYVLPLGLGDGDPLLPQYGTTGTGVYGASYPAAGGIYKNLGYLPTGYDGVDNDGNGMVDDYNEGVCHAPNWKTQDPAIVATISSNLSTHKHSTARAEMLYALLIEGRGPLGSVFSRDDFTDREVKDTDNDGLPEFIDAWGQPLQFFRWPLLYHSDIQRGQVMTTTSATSWALQGPYYIPTTGANANNAMLITREQDALDPNQQLMAPSWWSNTINTGGFAFTGNAGALNASNAVNGFEFFFHRLTEPMPTPGGAYYWDRGSTYPFRRAFYSKFLILSGGPDLTPGVFLYPDAAAPAAASAYIANENNALPFAISELGDFTTSDSLTGTSIDPVNTPASFAIQQAAQDDIANQSLAATGNLGGSG